MRISGSESNMESAQMFKSRVYRILKLLRVFSLLKLIIKFYRLHITYPTEMYSLLVPSTKHRMGAKFIYLILETDTYVIVMTFPKLA